MNDIDNLIIRSWKENNFDQIMGGDMAFLSTSVAWALISSMTQPEHGAWQIVSKRQSRFLSPTGAVFGHNELQYILINAYDSRAYVWDETRHSKIKISLKRRNLQHPSENWRNERKFNMKFWFVKG